MLSIKFPPTPNFNFTFDKRKEMQKNVKKNVKKNLKTSVKTKRRKELQKPTQIIDFFRANKPLRSNCSKHSIISIQPIPGDRIMIGKCVPNKISEEKKSFSTYQTSFDMDIFASTDFSIFNLFNQ